MKRILLPIIMGLGMLCISLSAQAQTAKVQVIHNSADPAAAEVDVYVNGGLLSALDNFAFRAATPFVEVPTTVDIGIALPNSTSVDDTLVNFPFTLDADETYVILATGVLTPANFDQTANGAAIAFGLTVLAGADTAATAGNISIAAAHGASDVGGVDVLANGGPLLDNLAYGTTQGYIEVPATEYVLQVTPEADNSNVVAGYHVDLGPLDGSSAFVFASGFLDPSANSNGEAFGLFAALTDGSVVALTAVGEARAQVVHNSADPGAATVDIYINTLTDTIKLDDFAFRAASGFVTLPTGYELDIVIAGPTSADITDNITTIPATLEADSTYVVIANGVLDPTMFAANPDMEATAFGLFVSDGIRETGTDAANVDINVFHGATDAPTVDVLANGGTPPLIDDLTYGNFSGYASVPAADYDLTITLGNDNTAEVATFDADVSGLGGGAGFIVASGFLQPENNMNGEGFGLLLVLADGNTSLLPLAVSIYDNLTTNNDLLQIAPNPFGQAATLTYSVEEAGTVGIQILDMAGRTLKVQQIDNVRPGSHEMTLNANEFAPGMYQVIMTTETSLSVQKIQVIR